MPSPGCRGGADDTSRLRLIYEKLTATSGLNPYAPMDQDWTFQARDPSDQPAIDACVAQTAPGLASFAGLLSEVAAAIAGRPNRAVALADGRNSVALITAIYASAFAGGASVSCPPGPEHALYGGWQPQEA